MRLEDSDKEVLNLDELQDDVLNFRDSDRDSVLSYFIANGKSFKN